MQKFHVVDRCVLVELHQVQALLGAVVVPHELLRAVEGRARPHGVAPSLVLSVA